MNKLEHYPSNHPVTLALNSFALAVNEGRDVFAAIQQETARAGIPFGGEKFDETAKLLDYWYLPLWDVYVDRRTYIAESAKDPLNRI